MDWVWSALVSEPGIGVEVVTAEGRVVYANDQIARMVDPGLSGLDLIGKWWSEYMPADWVAEWIPVVRRVAETGQSIVKRAIWRGVQYYTTLRVIPKSSDEIGRGGELRVLLITRAIPTTKEVDYVRQAQKASQVLGAEGADLGPLEVLTARELEVLALLGQGMGVEDTAKLLHRSPETVKTHRKSIAEKLGTSDRVVLQRMAAQAGLRLNDAELHRFSSGQQAGDDTSRR